MSKDITVGSVVFNLNPDILRFKKINEDILSNITKDLPVVVTIDELPQSYNKVLNMHWTKRREWKQRWELLTKQACRGYKPMTGKVRVEIIFHFKDKRRHDSDNYQQKGLLDGLVKCGLLEDDDIETVVETTHRGVRSDRDFTEIKIYRVEG